jgi:hypothetical protein
MGDLPLFSDSLPIEQAPLPDSFSVGLGYSVEDEKKLTEETENESGFWSNFYEGSVGVVSGPIKGVEGLAEFTNMVVNPWISLGENTWNYVSTGKWDSDLYQKEYFAESGVDITPEFLTSEEGSIAAINRDIVAFFSNYGLARKTMQTIPLLAKDPKKYWGLAKELVAGATADVTAFDPEDGTAIEHLLERYPHLSNPVFDFLVTEGDSDGIIKLKQALEGAGITGGLHIIIKGLSLFKQLNGDVINRFRAKRIEDNKIISEANKKGIIVDDVADAKVKIEIEGATKVKPKPVVKEVLLDLKELARNILNAKNIDDIDLPINVKNFKSHKDTQKIIEIVVKSMMKSQKKSWDTVITNKQVDELSSMMDMEANVLAKGLTQTDNIAELPFRVIATKKALQGLALEAKRLSKLITKGGASISTKTDLAKTLAIIANTTDELKTAIQSAARTTQVGRIKTGAAKIDINALNDVVKSFDGNIEAFAARMAKIDDFSSIRKMVQRSFTRRSWDAVTEIYINALLSGPITQVINLSSTFIETFLKPMELIAGGLATSFTRNGRRSVRLGFSRYRGMIKNIDDTLISVGKAFKEEDLIADKAGRIIEHQAPKAFSAQNFNIKNKTGARIFNAIGVAFRLPSRLLVTTDELFKQINYRGKLHELAVQKALTKNLKGAKFDSFIRNFEKKGFDDLGRFVNDEAKQYSRVSTFTEDLEGGAWANVGGIFQYGNRAVPLLKLFVPFVRTPTNLFRHAMQRLPITGLLQKRNLEMLMSGGTGRSEVIGRQMLGSLIIYKAVDLAADEKITGSGPKNPALREAWLLTHKPYSIKVVNDDGTTSWVAYNRMDPRFMVIGVIADMMQHLDESNPEAGKNIMAGLAVSLASNLASKTYTQGLTEIVTAIGTQSEKRFERYFQNLAMGFVPYSSFMRQTNNDEAMREVRSLADTLENITWGDAENLPPRRNILGEVQHKSKGVFGFPQEWWAPMVVGKTGTTENKALYTELAKLAATSKTDPGKGITKQAKKITGTNIDLTDEKYRINDALPYDRMLKLLTTFKMDGVTAQQALDILIKSPAYKELRGGAQTGYLNEAKGRMIQSVYNRYKTAIRNKVINENPKLKQDVSKFKIDKTNSLAPINNFSNNSGSIGTLMDY